MFLDTYAGMSSPSKLPLPVGKSRKSALTHEPDIMSLWALSCLR